MSICYGLFGKYKKRWIQLRLISSLLSSSRGTMKASSFACLLALVAMVSSAPQGSIPLYPTDPRSIFYPVPGIPVSNVNSELKPIDKMKPIALTVPVPGVTPVDSKPREWLSSTPTVAARSRCLEDYRSKKPDAPAPSAAEIASPHQYPFVVSIVYSSEDSKGYQLKCSGSLISPTQVLTEINCLYYNPTYQITYPVENLKVKLGMHFLNETTIDAQVTRNITKIKFVNEGRSHLTIVTMDSPVEYTDTISPVCLVPDCFDDDSGQSVIAMRWDYSSHPHEPETKNSVFLGLMRFSTLPMTKCYADKDTQEVFQNRKLCAQIKCGDFCSKYIGGPVVIENNSRSDPSCRFMQVGVFDRYYDHSDAISFSRVKTYLPWIEENSK